MFVSVLRPDSSEVRIFFYIVFLKVALIKFDFLGILTFLNHLMLPKDSSGS